MLRHCLPLSAASPTVRQCMARSLVYPAVWDSVKTRLLTPLHRAGYDISVFTVLSAGDRVSASRHKEELFSDVEVDEINQYVQPTASINAQEEEGTLINKACILKPNWYLMKHQDSSAGLGNGKR